MLALAACASPAAPPEKPLFRLATVSVAEGASATREAEPATSAAPDDAAAKPEPGPRAAYTTSLRLVRPDGTTLTAPRLTAFAGQRADIRIVKQTAYVEDFDVDRSGDAPVVDPVIGMLDEGLTIELVAVPAAGRPGEAAVGLRVASAAVRRPIATREVRIVSDAAGPPVTLQTPHVEEVEVAGARCVRLGEESEWARVPDPAGGSDLVVLGRVDAADVESSLEPTTDDDLGRARDALVPAGEPAAKAPPASLSDEFAHRGADLRGLAAVAAGGAPAGVLRVTALRMPSGGIDPDAPSAERLASLSVRTVMSGGVRVADVLREPFLANWDVGNGFSPAYPADPVIDTVASGLVSEVGRDGRLALQWTALPSWETWQTTLSHGPPVVIELPNLSVATRRVPASPGRTLHPMFTLPDGGTGAVLVEWTPDAAR